MVTKFLDILKLEEKNVLQRKLTLASNYDFVIPISLQPDGVDLGYFKIGLIFLGELMI